MKFCPFLYMSLLVFGMGCACRSSKTEAQASAPVPQEVKAAADLDRSVVAKISFKPGQNRLSPEATAHVQKALSDARTMGEIKNIEIVTWSDKDYPTHGQKLSAREVNLSNERAKTLQKLVDQAAPWSSVKTFNMAKQPNAFQKWIDTRDAHVKEKLVSAGVSDSAGRASSALLFIEVK